jgi:hypothetical protein
MSIQMMKSPRKEIQNESRKFKEKTNRKTNKTRTRRTMEFSLLLKSSDL